jgi:hypothetical protein
MNIYKNRTIEDAKWYLKQAFGINFKDINKYPEIKQQIESNAKEGYVLDCLLFENF